MRKRILLVLLSVLAFLFSYPCIFMLVGSFMADSEITGYLSGVLGAGNTYAKWSLLPKEPSIQSYIKMLVDTPEIFTMFWNSVKIVGAVEAGQVIVGIPAAWGLARYRFPFRKVIFVLYIVLMVMPFQVMMLAEYLVLKQLRLIDTLWAVIIPGIFSAFTVFVVYVSFRKIPENIIESARIDGAKEWRILWDIGIPMAKDGIISAMVLTFLEYWNLIEQPMTFLQTKSRWPLSLYLSATNSGEIGLNFCVSILALIPAGLVFMIGEKYLQNGIGTMVQE